jgi:hypothetical protein
VGPVPLDDLRKTYPDGKGENKGDNFWKYQYWRYVGPPNPLPNAKVKAGLTLIGLPMGGGMPGLLPLFPLPGSAKGGTGLSDVQR